MDELERKLGYQFKDKTLLSNALCHSSYANEHKSAGETSNERLEFLGDSVLGLAVANHLYVNFPNMPEGRMTRLRAELVCEHSLYTAATSLELGKYIRLGKGEENSGGRNRASILADAAEAVIAALYLDGGMAVARDFVSRFILADKNLQSFCVGSDWKTALQELVQHNPGSKLIYEPVSETGPDHNKTFTVRVLLDGKNLGVGSGRTKKEAEQNAAKAGLEELSK